MLTGSTGRLLLFFTLCNLFLAQAHSQELGARIESRLPEQIESPMAITTQYLLTAQRMALFWVQAKPWPSHYQEYLTMVKEEFAPMLSQAALSELQSKPAAGPRELMVSGGSSSADDKELYEGMISCVAKAHFTVLQEEIVGDSALVEVETTIDSPFGSGKSESFQDKLKLVRENGRWVLTPQAFKTFFF